MIRIIQRSETDPYYNIAAEEYLLKTAVTDTFMIWRNKPSVIVGKHQNASREINHAFIESRHLPVIRRITGGGTVYHDLGNINFTFIYTSRKENLVDFKYFTEPVVLFLKQLGLNAVFGGKNNILVDGMKVSGNSAHIFKNKVLHHGTLLFNTDLDALKQAIAGKEGHYKDKSVRSVRFEVSNISGLLPAKITTKGFIGLFQAFIFNYFNGAPIDALNKQENESILKLVSEKYLKNEWNFGYSPEYKYDELWKTNEGEFSVSLFVKDGVILKAEIYGPETRSLLMKTVADFVTGSFHDKKSISERLKKLTFTDKTEKEILNKISNHMF